MDDYLPSSIASVVLWLVAIGAALASSWRGSSPKGGLSIAYLASLATIHLISELSHQFVDSPMIGTRPASALGFRVSGLAMIGWLVGWGAISLTARKPAVARFAPQELTRLGISRAGNVSSEFRPVFDRLRITGAELSQPLALARKIGVTAIVGGVLLYFFIAPLVAFIPSATSVLSGGLILATAGVCWWQYAEMRDGRPYRSLAVAGICITFPMMTILIAGFMGFGVFAIITVGCFLLANYRPRVVIMIAAPVAIFLGLSLYPNYMQARNAIRASVWGGESLERRLESSAEMFGEKWVWFNLGDDDQQKLLDSRLNQNVLVGLAQSRLAAGRNEYAFGESLWQAVGALIPRAIWADKPTYGGSGGWVAKYTGMTFGKGTSVGLGHVMEFLVNFGVFGVFIGFSCLGAGLAFIDDRCGESMKRGDARTFMIWFVPGQALLNNGGLLAEATAAYAGFLLLAWGFCVANSLNLPRAHGRLRTSAAGDVKAT